MPYGETALPSTGGGILFGGLAGMFYGWNIALCVIILGFLFFGIWRLYRGQKETKEL